MKRFMKTIPRKTLRSLALGGRLLFDSRVGRAARRRLGIVRLVCLTTAIASLCATRTHAELLYFVENNAGTIGRANLDGTGIETVISSLADPRYIDVDTATGKIYWTSGAGNRIQRASVNGSGLEDIVTGTPLPSGIALDRSSGEVYWTALLGDATVRRTNPNGNTIDDLVIREGSQNFRDIAVDNAHGQMYWADDNGFTPGIWRANLDGSSATQIVSGYGFTDSPQAVDLDLVNNKVYWTDRELDTIARSNLDGSDVETVIDSGLQNPRGIVLDAANNRLYWSDASLGVIESASLDGSGRTAIITGLTDPVGLSLGPRALSGDVNEDGVVNGLDVDPFVYVLVEGTDDNATRILADMTGDGVVNGLDVEPFVAAVVRGGTQQIPEPSTLLLVLVAMGIAGGWRKWAA